MSKIVHNGKKIDINKDVNITFVKNHFILEGYSGFDIAGRKATVCVIGFYNKDNLFENNRIVNALINFISKIDQPRELLNETKSDLFKALDVLRKSL